MVISMERWVGKVAIVTGASVGIGAAIVEQLVSAGLQVVGLARRSERVEELAEKLGDKSGKLYAVKADVSQEDDVLQAFKWVEENLGPVHILVNNAGFSRDTSLIEGETDLWRQILETNVLGLCITTREAVKSMRANDVQGHIVHINSIAGHTVPKIANLNVYPASKHAVTALTETLRLELNAIDSKIKITSVSPGVVRTEFLEASGVVPTPEFQAYLEVAPMLKPEDIADGVLYVLATPPNVQVHELSIRPIGEQI